MTPTGPAARRRRTSHRRTSATRPTTSFAVAFDIDHTLTSPFCDLNPGGMHCTLAKARMLDMVQVAKRHAKVHISTARNGRRLVRVPQEVQHALRDAGLTDARHFHAGPIATRRLRTAMQKVDDLRTIAQQNGLSPRHVVLVDDLLSNCEAARQNGFQAIHIPSGGATRETVDALRAALTR